MYDEKNRLVSTSFPALSWGKQWLTAVNAAPLLYRNAGFTRPDCATVVRYSDYCFFLQVSKNKALFSFVLQPLGYMRLKENVLMPLLLLPKERYIGRFW